MLKLKFSTICILFFVVSVSLYLPHPQASFILDDHYVIETNPLIKNSFSLSSVFSAGLFDAYKSSWNASLNYYRPVPLLTYALEYRLWGLTPYGYYWVNILIHFLNCLLIFTLISRLSKDRYLAFLTAFIFCILPVQQWVVRYLTGRADLLSTFFSLAALLAFMFYLERKKVAWLLLGLGSFILGILSKETVILLPLYCFLIAYISIPNVKKACVLTAPFIILSGLYYVLRGIYFPIVSDGVNISIVQGLASAGEYFFRFFIAWGFLYKLPKIFHQPFLGYVMFCGLGLISIWVYKNTAGNVFRKAMWVWLLLGVSNFILTQKTIAHTGPYLSEHFLYFTSIGFAAIVGGLFAALPSTQINRAVLILICLFYISIQYYHFPFWKDEKTLLTHVAYMEGNQPFAARQQLLMRYSSDSKSIEEILSTQTDPRQKSIWLRRLGEINRLEGKSLEAGQLFEQAVSENPDNIDALNALGISYIERGEKDKGLLYLKQSLAKDKNYAETNRLLGAVYYHYGDFETARLYLKQAVEYNPDNREAVNMLKTLSK